MSLISYLLKYCRFYNLCCSCIVVARSYVWMLNRTSEDDCNPSKSGKIKLNLYYRITSRPEKVNWNGHEQHSDTFYLNIKKSSFMIRPIVPTYGYNIILPVINSLAYYFYRLDIIRTIFENFDRRINCLSNWKWLFLFLLLIYYKKDDMADISILLNTNLFSFLVSFMPLPFYLQVLVINYVEFHCSVECFIKKVVNFKQMRLKRHSL